MVTREQMQINGAPVRIHGSYDREIKDDTGQTVAEMEVVIIVRGRLPNKQFVQLIARDQILLEYQDGRDQVRMVTRIVKQSEVASGSGEGSIFRHDIVFRELPESWQRRAMERAQQPVIEAPRPAPARSLRELEPVQEMSQVLTATSPSTWGESIKKMQSNAPRLREPEEPLTLPELAAIETVLINLRVEALIQQLEAAGVLQRGAVDARFRSLLAERFVDEATPLVGEKVAKRASRDVLQG